MDANRRRSGLPLWVLTFVTLGFGAADPAYGEAAAPQPAQSAPPAGAPAAAQPAPAAAAGTEIGAWPAGRGSLTIEVSAGDVRIVPGAAGRIRVVAAHVDADDDANVDLRADFRAKGAGGRLEVRARDDVDVTIEVPANAALVVRMSAGRLEIGPITGDKDVRLNAGQLRLHATDAEIAADARLSVTTGEIRWQRLDVYKGGLFRSYSRDGGGDTTLRARVIAGELQVL